MLLTFKNLKLALIDQFPLKRLLRNLFKGHILGLFSKRSHVRDSNQPKIMYHSKASAMKAANAMSKKHGVHFSNYKCLHCKGYHVGKNRDNKKDN